MKHWQFVLIGVGVIALGIYNYVSARNFIELAVSAKGAVIDVQRQWDFDDNEYTYYPRIRFETEDGRAYEFVDGGSSSADKIGAEVSVLYDPANPYLARRDSSGGIWIMPVVLGVIGLVTVGRGIHGILGERKAPDRADDQQITGNAEADNGTVDGPATPGSSTLSRHE